jgi:O-antigen/teichoic acid export membrane protein
MATGVVIVGIILKNLPINVWDDIDARVYLFFLPALFFFVLTVYLRQLLHGQLLIGAVNISELLERILYIFIFVLLVWHLDLGLRGVALSLSISSLFIFLYLFIKANKYENSQPKDSIPHSRKVLLKQLWAYGRWTYYSSFIQYVIANFPILFLKSSVGSFSQIGFFSKARGLAEYPKIPAVQLSGLLFSFNAGAKQELANYRTETICRVSFWGATVFFISLAIVIKPFISFLYGNEFLPAAQIFYFLYPSIVFYIQGLYLNSALAAKGYNKETFIIKLKSLPIVLIAAYFLITHLGIVGAAITVSFSSTLMWYQSASKYCSIFDSSYYKIILLQKEDLELFKMIFYKFFNLRKQIAK